MIVLWTIIVILGPTAPQPEAFKELCAIQGGKLDAQGTFSRMPDMRVVRSVVLRCIGPNLPEPPKIGA